MNGTIVSRTLKGLLILGAALAFASAGCVDPTDESESEGDEDVVSVDQQLEPVDGDDPAGEGDLDMPDNGGDASRGDDRKGPEPQPWRAANTTGPDPNPDPVQNTSSSTPSGGHSGK